MTQSDADRLDKVADVGLLLGSAFEEVTRGIADKNFGAVVEGLRRLGRYAEDLRDLAVIIPIASIGEEAHNELKAGADLLAAASRLGLDATEHPSVATLNASGAAVAEGMDHLSRAAEAVKKWRNL